MQLSEWLSIKGWTLKRLERESGVSYTTLHYLKTGRIHIHRYDIAERISQATGGRVTIKDLCTPKEGTEAGASSGVDSVTKGRTRQGKNRKPPHRRRGKQVRA